MKVLFCWFIPALTCACNGNQPSTLSYSSEDELSIDSISDQMQPEPVFDLHEALYTKQDSILIEKLLQDAEQLSPAENRMLFFGKKFIGIPYVAHTLEKGDHEMLVVNTKELDCTTFVETCAALTIFDQQDKRKFTDYCQILSNLRYKNGIKDGYTSRLHYASQWIADNEQKGNTMEITHEGTPFTAIQHHDIHYMSTHQESYSWLKQHPEDVKTIKAQEEEINGQDIRYIPKALLNKTQDQLTDIHDGDILGLITSNKGLDISHLGLAVWQNGKLHLLKASSLHKAVWIDPKTLYDYSKNKQSNLGIRVIRVR